MWGGLFGCLFAVILCLSTDVSWWWVLWSSLIGAFIELAVRVGAGEEVGDAIVSCIDIGTQLSAVGDFSSGGDFGGGGDGGGGDGGGGGGD